MAKLTLAKNLHLCFSMLKRHPQLTTTSTTTTAAPPHSPPREASLVKTYNSLFEDTLPTAAMSSEDADMADIEAVVPTTPDLTAAYASRRFFISSPGRSNSIVDSLELSSLEEEEHPPGPTEDVGDMVAGGVAVHTYSPDPYADFRRSMEEMVAARELKRVEEAWEYLQELLLSYLALNPKSTHKYIVGAFADLVFSLLSPHDHDNHERDHDLDHDSDDLDRSVIGRGVDGSTSLSSESSSSSCGGSGGETMEHE